MAVEITKEQRDTIEYYNTHADEYCDATRNVDMSALYAEFEKYLKSGCKILDLGCGSGRDSKYFHDKGYEVVAADPSAEMCKRTRELVPIEVFEMRAEDLNFEDEFDAVWACASLLHVNRSNMNVALTKIINSLKNKGVIYASWKYGNSDIITSERCFTNYDTNEIKHIFDKNTLNLKIIKVWNSIDAKNRKILWINVLAEYEK